MHTHFRCFHLQLISVLLPSLRQKNLINNANVNSRSEVKQSIQRLQESSDKVCPEFTLLVELIKHKCFIVWQQSENLANRYVSQSTSKSQTEFHLHEQNVAEFKLLATQFPSIFKVRFLLVYLHCKVFCQLRSIQNQTDAYFFGCRLWLTKFNQNCWFKKGTFSK